MATRSRRSGTAGAGGEPGTSTLNPALIQLLPTNRLKEELALRGLDTKGPKNALADRLAEAVHLGKSFGEEAPAPTKTPRQRKSAPSKSQVEPKVEVESEHDDTIEALEEPVKKIAKRKTSAEKRSSTNVGEVKEESPEEPNSSSVVFEEEFFIESSSTQDGSQSKRPRRQRKLTKTMQEYQKEEDSDVFDSDDDEPLVSEKKTSIIDLTEGVSKKKLKMDDSSKEKREKRATGDEDWIPPEPMLEKDKPIAAGPSRKWAVDKDKEKDRDTEREKDRERDVDRKPLKPTPERRPSLDSRSAPSSVPRKKPTVVEQWAAKVAEMKRKEQPPASLDASGSSSTPAAATSKPLSVKTEQRSKLPAATPSPAGTSSDAARVLAGAEPKKLAAKRPSLSATPTTKVDVLDDIIGKQTEFLKSKYSAQDEKAALREREELEKKKKELEISMRREEALRRVATIPPPPPPRKMPLPPPGLVEPPALVTTPSSSTSSSTPTPTATKSPFAGAAQLPPPPPPPRVLVPPPPPPRNLKDTASTTVSSSEKPSPSVGSISSSEHRVTHQHAHHKSRDVNERRERHGQSSYHGARATNAVSEDMAAALANFLANIIPMESQNESEVKSCMESMLEAVVARERDLVSIRTPLEPLEPEPQDEAELMDISESLQKAERTVTATEEPAPMEEEEPQRGTDENTAVPHQVPPVLPKVNPLELLLHAQNVLQQMESNGKPAGGRRSMYEQIQPADIDLESTKPSDSEKPMPIFHGEPVPSDDDDDLFAAAAGAKRKSTDKKKVVTVEEEDAPNDEIVELDYYNSDLFIKGMADRPDVIEPDNSDGLALMYGGVKANHGVRIAECDRREEDEDEETGSTLRMVVFQIKILEQLPIHHLPFEELEPYDVRMGFSFREAPNFLGEAPRSYAFSSLGKMATNSAFSDYGSGFAVGDIDLSDMSISFRVNDDDLGIAFRRVPAVPGDVLFPHVCTKNSKVMVNFGYFPEGDEVWKRDGSMDWTFWADIPRNRLVRASPRPPESRQSCTVLMMVGLPGCGKSTWVRDYLAEHPQEQWTLINTDMAMAAMKVSGVPRSRVHQGRWDMIMGLTAKAVAKLVMLAARRRRNYIIDLTNCSKDSRRKRLQHFKDFTRKCVVMIPSDEEFVWRQQRQARQEGTNPIPAEAMLELKAVFSIPNTETEPIEEVVFIEPPPERISDAIEQVLKYNEEARPWFQGRFRGRGRGRGRGAWLGDRPLTNSFSRNSTDTRRSSVSVPTAAPLTILDATGSSGSTTNTPLPSPAVAAVPQGAAQPSPATLWAPYLKHPSTN